MTNKKMKSLLLPSLLLAILLCWAAPGRAQVPDDGSLQISIFYVWNGTAWVRGPGDATNGLTVNMGANNDVTVSGSLTTITTLTTITNPVTVTDGAGALNVICDSGCGTTDTEDGSVAGGQTGALGIGLGYLWNGTTWERAPTTQPVSGTFWQATQPVSGTFWQATQPVSAISLPLPAGAATAALQTQPGVDIGDVTINNGAGASAVNVQDGGNALTVDGTVTANAGTGSFENSSVDATGSAVPANATFIGGTNGTNTTALFVDPCQREAKTFSPVDIVTATTTIITTATASQRVYVCSITLFAAGTTNVALIEGTGGTCGTGTAGVAGGATAGEGFNLTAQTGIAFGNGYGAVLATAGTNVDLCLITSAAVQVSGAVTWVKEP